MTMSIIILYFVSDLDLSNIEEDDLQNEVNWLTNQQKTEIEKLQLYASWVITGAIKGMKHSEIYKECDLT